MTKFHQVLHVRGAARQRLLLASSQLISRTLDSEAITSVHGHGALYPHIKTDELKAWCGGPVDPSCKPLGDISPLVDFVLNSETLIVSDSTIDEVREWIRQ